LVGSYSAWIGDLFPGSFGKSVIGFLHEGVSVARIWVFHAQEDYVLFVLFSRVFLACLWESRVEDTLIVRV
jgi:predicted peptidase